MNLFIRLLKVIFGLVINKKTLGLLDISSVAFRVWPNDLDINGHMNNGRYMTLLDLGRFDLLFRIGLFWPAFRKHWNPILGSSQIRFRRSLTLGQKFSMHTRIICWDEKWVYLEQRIESQGHLVTIAYLKGIFRGPQGNIPMQEVLTCIPYKEASPLMPDSLKMWLEAEAKMAQAL